MTIIYILIVEICQIIRTVRQLIQIVVRTASALLGGPVNYHVYLTIYTCPVFISI